MRNRGIFVAATGQNVGKTTACLGLVYGLRNRYKSVGYMKPVGQEHVTVENDIKVDKDVVLFRSHFSLKDPFEEMSPVLFPRGFTRDYLDGKVSHEDLVDKIEHSFQAIISRYPITVVEGTGHTGVGSIVDLNNAQVAAKLEIPLILVASGGLGSTFDEMELNKAQCEKHGVKIAGVILNRVLDEKREMVIQYMNKALKKWNVPLLGAIPYDPFLSTPTMSDFEQLFQTPLLTAPDHRLLHFENMALIASAEELLRIAHNSQLLIAPADREDILSALLKRYWSLKKAHPEEALNLGLILTGKIPPQKTLITQINEAQIPMLYSPLSSFVAMKMINSYTTKIRTEDAPKILETVRIVESHIDFESLEKAIK